MSLLERRALSQATRALSPAARMLSPVVCTTASTANALVCKHSAQPWLSSHVLDFGIIGSAAGTNPFVSLSSVEEPLDWAELLRSSVTAASMFTPLLGGAASVADAMAAAVSGSLRNVDALVSAASVALLLAGSAGTNEAQSSWLAAKGVESRHLSPYLADQVSAWKAEVAEMWEEPLVTKSPWDEATLEWWHGQRKLTVYVPSAGFADYIRVWGADMDSEMEDGTIRSADDFAQHWSWLLGR